MHPTENRGGSNRNCHAYRPHWLALSPIHKISLGHQKRFRKHSTLQPCTAQLKHVCMHSYTRRLCRPSQHHRLVNSSARNICTNIFQWRSCPIKTNAPSGVADQANAAAQLADWSSAALHTAAGAALAAPQKHPHSWPDKLPIMLSCSSKPASGRVQWVWHPTPCMIVAQACPSHHNPQSQECTPLMYRHPAALAGICSRPAGTTACTQWLCQQQTNQDTTRHYQIQNLARIYEPAVAIKTECLCCSCSCAQQKASQGGWHAAQDAAGCCCAGCPLGTYITLAGPCPWPPLLPCCRPPPWPRPPPMALPPLLPRPPCCGPPWPPGPC